MGLKSDSKNGVKAQLKTRFPQAFKEFANLLDARDASMATREETFSCIDGNVLFRSVPQNARTLDAHVSYLTVILKKAIATCFVTAVVFDDPACLTKAKVEEQQKRDASKRSTAVVCSSDLVGSIPLDDNYGKKQIEEATDVSPFVQNRKTRLRFFDEVSVRVLRNLQSQIERWGASGHPGGHIIFDGIDVRGGDRPLGSLRDPQIVSSSESVAALFVRTVPIGEGDLKLADLGRRARMLSVEGEYSFDKVKLSLCTTIDTDSFAIELLEEAKRNKEPKVSKKPFNTLLCMRERAKKRGADDDHDAFYLCCDVTLLQALLQQSMWGVSRSPSPDDRHAALTLMVAGWALCGCDFVEYKGMRSDVVFDSIDTVIKSSPSAIENAKFAWSGNRGELSLMYQPIQTLAIACASRLLEIPRIKKDHLMQLRNLDDMFLKRVAWICAYWNSCEFKGNMDDFGFYLPTSEDLPTK